MSYTKQQLIEMLSPALEDSTRSTPASVQDTLNTYSLDELNRELWRQQQKGLVPMPQTPKTAQQNPIPAQQHQVVNDPQQREHERQAEEAYRGYYMTQIFLTAVPGHGVPVRNQASEEIILSWLNLDESLNRDWFLKVIRENPELAKSLQWQSADPTKRKQAESRQLEIDRQTFAEVCRRNLVSECQANFNLWRSTNSVSGMAPASPEELAAYKQEAVEQRNEFLLNADVDTLKKLAREESAVKRQTAIQTEADRQLAAATARDAVLGFPPLPETWNGQKLDAAFIKNCSSETQKLLSRRFGSSQITARLRGLA